MSMHLGAVRVWQFLAFSIILVAALWLLRTDIKEYRVSYWLYSVVFLALLAINLLWPESFLVMAFTFWPFVKPLYFLLVGVLITVLIGFFFVDPAEGIFSKVAAADLLLIVSVLLLSPMRGSLALFISGIIGITVWGLIKRQSKVPFVGLLSIIMLLVVFVDALWRVL